MPRKKPELTFQKGAAGREGRWKKRYLGRTYYLGPAPSRSDRSSYAAALAKWEQKKAEVDAEQLAKSKPNEADYGLVISEWEGVLQWSVSHNDADNAELARTKLAELRERLERKVPPAIKDEDRLWSRLHLASNPQPHGPVELVVVASADSPFAFGSDVDVAPTRTCPDPNPVPSLLTPASEGELLEERWRDRLEHLPSAVAKDRTLEAQSSAYLDSQKERARVGDIKPSSFTRVDVAIRRFRDWCGGGVDVADLDGDVLLRYRDYLLSLVATDELSRRYARDQLDGVKQLLRHLHDIDVIEQLPKVMQLRRLSIAVGSSRKVTLSAEDVAAFRQHASERAELYLLLMLNIGGTAKDLSDLQHDEWDRSAQTITRKREKIELHASAPTVTYRLWPETIELLKEFAQDRGRLLLNRDGNPLVVERLGADGKTKRTDSVATLFRRVTKTAGIQAPPKSCRKTGSTLMENDGRYARLVDQYLANSPSGTSQRHYTKDADSLFDEAVAWIRLELRIGSPNSLQRASTVD